MVTNPYASPEYIAERNAPFKRRATLACIGLILGAMFGALTGFTGGAACGLIFRSRHDVSRSTWLFHDWGFFQMVDSPRDYALENGVYGAILLCVAGALVGSIQGWRARPGRRGVIGSLAFVALAGAFGFGDGLYLYDLPQHFDIMSVVDSMLVAAVGAVAWIAFRTIFIKLARGDDQQIGVALVVLLLAAMTTFMLLAASFPFFGHGIPEVQVTMQFVAIGLLAVILLAALLLVRWFR